ncbi:MAG TPA: MFS transporter [Phycisphaerales bacterium]|nr:MFS transporter [Phycisphaerales bacterium]
MSNDLPASSPSAPSSWRSAVRGNVLMMGLVSLLTDFSSEMINPILPIFFAYLAGGAEAALWVGLSEGIAETTASLLKIFSGRISDRLGKRKALVIVGYGLSAVCRPAMALVGAGVAGAAQVVGLKFGDRVGKGIRTSPRDALIGDSVGADVRGLAFSFHRAMDHMGAVLGPLAVIVILYAFLGYARWGKQSAQGVISGEEAGAIRWLFGVALVPGVLAVLALIFKVREIAPPPAASHHKADATRFGVWGRLPGRFYAFVGVVTLFALGNSSDMFLLLLGWKLFGLGLVPLVTLWIALHVSKIVFSIPGGLLSDKLGRRPVIVAGYVVYALVYLGMAYVSHLWQFVALFIAYGFYYGMTEGAEKALVTDFVPSEYRGTAFGIFHGAVGLAALPASLIFGVLWTVLERVQEGLGARVAFSIGATLAGLAAMLMLVLLSTSRRAPAGAEVNRR